MRPSLRKGAYVAFSSAAWQEIRVRSGRDDNSSWKLYLAFSNKIVVPSEAEGSAVRPSGFPNAGVKMQSFHADSKRRTVTFDGLRVGLNRRELKLQALILGQDGDGYSGQ
jgi:hypothetical protein